MSNDEEFPDALEQTKSAESSSVFDGDEAAIQLDDLGESGPA